MKACRQQAKTAAHRFMPSGNSNNSVTPVLSQQAVQALQKALSQQRAAPSLLREERSIRQPDSWLVERCWVSLAEAGATEAALVLASLISHRQPLAVPKALVTLAEQAKLDNAETLFVQKRLDQHGLKLLQTPKQERETYQENLLLTSSAAGQVHMHTLVYSCLERLDQMPGVWRQIMASPEMRPALAGALASVDLHPLTTHLIRGCLNRYEVDGALFLNELSALLVDDQGSVLPGRGPTMRRCLQAASQLVTGDVSMRRFVTCVLARGGEGQAVLSSVNTLAIMMEARQETAPPVRDADESILRHVVRKNANMEVDFQVFTLQESLRALPAAKSQNDEAAEMVEHLVSLGGRSDGWTASSAISALVDAGWFEAAARMVDSIAPTDATKSDAICGLVEGLLNHAKWDDADAQVRRLWPWIMKLDDEHVKWLTVRRLAELYVLAGLPDRGILLLAPQRPPLSWRRLFRAKENVPEERQLDESRVRLLCLLADSSSGSQGEEKALMRRLTSGAQALLQGEAQAAFYLRLLPHLVEAQRWTFITDLLPGIQAALGKIKGQKHAVRTREFASLLALALKSIPFEHRPWLAKQLTRWIQEFWVQALAGGIWQVVYSIDGCLELVQAIEGPQPLLDIGRYAQSANQNLTWGRAVTSAVQQAADTL